MVFGGTCNGGRGGGLQEVRMVFGGTCNGGRGGGLQEVRMVFGGTCNRGRSTTGEDGIWWDLQWEGGGGGVYKRRGRYSVGPAIGGGLQEVRTVFAGTCN